MTYFPLFTKPSMLVNKKLNNTKKLLVIYLDYEKSVSNYYFSTSFHSSI